jgi:formiminotetrahydrofolate cyclodeaminase
MTTIKHTVALNEIETRRVKSLAELHGCVAQAGPTAGEGSVHALVKAIAEGRLEVVSKDAVERLQQVVADGS